MIPSDSSVWIDYFRGIATPQCDRLDALLGAEIVATGDIILAEVLQGFERGAQFYRAMTALTTVDIGGRAIVLAAARNYRTLHRLGVTPRKTIDTLIATRCIESGHALLYSDRDFEPFVEHMGLESAMALHA